MLVAPFGYGGVKVGHFLKQTVVDTSIVRPVIRADTATPMVFVGIPFRFFGHDAGCPTHSH